MATQQVTDTARGSEGAGAPGATEGKELPGKAGPDGMAVRGERPRPGSRRAGRQPDRWGSGPCGTQFPSRLLPPRALWQRPGRGAEGCDTNN